jgi:hypothetical protein
MAGGPAQPRWRQPRAAAACGGSIHARGPFGPDLELLQIAGLTRAIPVRSPVLDAIAAAGACRQARPQRRGDGAGNTVCCKAAVISPSRQVGTPVPISGVPSPARPARRAVHEGRVRGRTRRAGALRRRAADERPSCRALLAGRNERITATIEPRQARGGQQPIREERAARRFWALTAGKGGRNRVGERTG